MIETNRRMVRLWLVSLLLFMHMQTPVVIGEELKKDHEVPPPNQQERVIKESENKKSEQRNIEGKAPDDTGNREVPVDKGGADKQEGDVPDTEKQASAATDQQMEQPVPTMQSQDQPDQATPGEAKSATSHQRALPEDSSAPSRPCYPSEAPAVVPPPEQEAVTPGSQQENVLVAPEGTTEDVPTRENKPKEPGEAHSQPRVRERQTDTELDVKQGQDKPAETTQQRAQTPGTVTDKVVQEKKVAAESPKEAVTADTTAQPDADTVTEHQATDQATEKLQEKTKTEPAPEVKPEVKEEVEMEAPKGEEMPSFDEWKQKMLAEQEKNKQTAQSSDTPSPSVIKPKPVKKNRMNTAAASCGAKVLAANPEAQNPLAILNENRDQYLINPCKAKKWFVVELCEPVQVRNIEVGNLELFSSTPEKFVVQVSDRYPAKDWVALGNFHAHDERAVQSFSVEGEEMYAKYVKVEMISHYGQEHYCPLSILRVYGTSVEEELEEQETHGAEPDIEEATETGQDTDQDQPASLFSNAKETVMHLVKTVLTQGEEENASANGTERNDSGMGNISDSSLQGEPVVVSGSHEFEPTPPVPRDGRPPAPAKQTTGQALPDIPNVTIPSADKGKQDSSPSGGGQPARPSVTVRQSQTDLVTLIESPSDKLRRIFSDCLLCDHETETFPVTQRQRLCAYYRAMHPWCSSQCTQSTSIVPAPNNLFAGDTSLVQDDQRVANTAIHIENTVHLEPSKPGILDKQTSDASIPTPNLETEKVKLTDIHIQPVLSTQSNAVSISTTPLPHTQPPPTIHSATTVINEPNFILVETKGTSKESSAVIQTSATQKGSGFNATATASQTSVTPGSDDSDPDQGKMGPEVVQIRPSSVTLPAPGEAKAPPSSEDQSKHTHEHSHDEKGTEEPLIKPTSISDEVKPTDDAQVVIDASTETTKESGNGAGIKDIYPNSPETDDKIKDMEMEFTVPPGDETPGFKLSTRKETAYMRLNNRLKALELNLNLSSSYLEELSKRYKRQMEDMYHSLNKTITKLTNMSKQAEQRDLRQQEHIATLNKHIENLTFKVQDLYKDMEAMQVKAIERHLYLMFIEAVVFIIIITFCLRPKERQPRRASTSGVSKSHRSRSRSFSPRRHPPKDDVLMRRPRSSSSICIGESKGLEELGNESNPQVTSSHIPKLVQGSNKDQTNEAFKKKKKKKKVTHSASSSNLQAHSVSSHQSTSRLSSAGLLFDATKENQRPPVTANHIAPNSSVTNHSAVSASSHTGPKPRHLSVQHARAQVSHARGAESVPVTHRNVRGSESVPVAHRNVRGAESVPVAHRNGYKHPSYTDCRKTGSAKLYESSVNGVMGGTGMNGHLSDEDGSQPWKHWIVKPKAPHK